MRYIHNARYNSHTEPLLKKSSVLNVHDLFKYYVLLFMYDYTTNALPSSFNNIFIHHYDVNSLCLTRQSNNFYIKRVKSKLVSCLPLYSFPSIWNDWISLTGSIPNRCILKIRIKQTLLDAYNTIVYCKNPKCPDCRQGYLAQVMHTRIAITYKMY